MVVKLAYTVNPFLMKLSPKKVLPEKNTHKEDYIANTWQICLQFNYTSCASKFPTSFKFTNVTPVVRMDLQTSKFPPKLFERLIHW